MLEVYYGDVLINIVVFEYPKAAVSIEAGVP